MKKTAKELKIGDTVYVVSTYGSITPKEIVLIDDTRYDWLICICVTPLSEWIVFDNDSMVNRDWTVYLYWEDAVNSCYDSIDKIIGELRERVNLLSSFIEEHTKYIKTKTAKDLVVGDFLYQIDGNMIIGHEILSVDRCIETYIDADFNEISEEVIYVRVLFSPKDSIVTLNFHPDWGRYPYRGVIYTDREDAIR